MRNRRFKIKLYLAVGWLLLTTSLTFWWLYFALGLLAKVESSNQGHRQMLFMEGMTLLALLVAGGTTLIYFIFLEQRQNETLARFFSAFSHDLKTSLASLRLQAESLKEDIRSPEALPTIQRLLSDTSRLQVQVENSLFLGQSRKPRLFLEDLESQDLLATLSDSWPQLKCVAERPFVVHGDRRAVETVFSNLAHNSLIHGRSTEIRFAPEARGDLLKLRIVDNGTGFRGRREELGKMHFRQNPSSGSGLGLFIVSELVRQMRGTVEFASAEEGFAVELTLPGRLA